MFCLCSVLFVLCQGCLNLLHRNFHFKKNDAFNHFFYHHGRYHYGHNLSGNPGGSAPEAALGGTAEPYAIDPGIKRCYYLLKSENR